MYIFENTNMLSIHGNMITVGTGERYDLGGLFTEKTLGIFVKSTCNWQITYMYKPSMSPLFFGCQRHQAAPDRRKPLGGVGSAAHGMSLGFNIFKGVIYRSLEFKPSSPANKKWPFWSSGFRFVSFYIEIYPWWLEMVFFLRGEAGWFSHFSWW